ncbi:MAG: primosomal protein N' [Oscillospiraceae bacterium]
MPLAARVAVADATIYYDKQYTYTVPTRLEGHIFVGSLVLVPFGRGKARPRTGVVLQLEEEAAVRSGQKELLAAAPPSAALTDELLGLVRHLKERTFCTWFEAVRTVLPQGAQYRAVQQGDGTWALQEQLPRASETVYALPEEPVATPDKARALTEKQKRVLEALKVGPLPQAELCAACEVTAAVPRGLLRRGLVATTRRQRQPDAALPGFAPLQAAAAAPYDLTPGQAAVADALAGRIGQPKPRAALLYGVTGSGKTPVFIHLIQAALAAGKTALVLVPEIGLTPQMTGRLVAAFGAQVAVQHSGLSPTQRLLQWNAIRGGEAKVVVGTRSAVFAPLEDIGVVIVDEEQEHTYQSEKSPRYDAVSIAARRASTHGALLLLASATPLVSHYYAATTGKMDLFELPERYGSLPLPAVQMVDMAQELLAGNPSALSRALAEGIEETLADGGQVILLLNRRGYHRAAVCKTCGKAVKCGACSLPMTYHKHGRAAHSRALAQAADDGTPLSGRLVCHTCGRSMPAPQACPECGGALRYAGFGTQRLQEELAQRLPQARVLRMDMDTTGRRGAHAHMLARFAAGDYDILLGTQMVAKGLDFERVRLVGVVGIDSLLFGQGYRSYENVFSLVTQVVGRAGRAGSAGAAIVQTVDPENPVLRLAAAQDYPAFFRQEVAFRKLALYPPFCALCVAGFAAGTEADALAAAAAFSRLLAQQASGLPSIPLRVLGPAPMPVFQVSGSYRYRLTLKCRNDRPFRDLLRGVLAAYSAEGWPKKATVWLDFHTEG